ncbi:lipid asymmetry maintenance ABC transporter permease subunit MlaE [Spiribacter sp. 2438]|uniref:lipid asymmetry maintenance ABC transporter permease subunit MlaE n=1 Tax=Spiribacter sp. 2438 TaxID=2666185 RepID=UPI0012B0372E|nr:lipid asymmetry maintenance ABC transporter permease subunit MlaE [Spiribacter sp. 2438]QGM22174.1 lipid asymmetry maintenance ABC transporter permease subunit MlaE [Spiribacter sp. 2438]
MTASLQAIGATALKLMATLGRSTLFLVRVVGGMGELVKRPRLLVQQLYSVGVLTLVIIMVSGVFVGMVLALQGYYTLVDFGAEQSLGVLVALTLTRELGPVVTALLFAGRAGSALTAEIGLMKATEQLAGMEMMAVDPERRIIAPRLLAALLSVPLLSAVFTLLGILGAYAVATAMLGIDGGSYWSQMQASVSFSDDVMNGMVKSVAFGLVAGWIAVFNGYDCRPTSQGVSRATTRTVVITSLVVLGLDFVLTALMFD